MFKCDHCDKELEDFEQCFAIAGEAHGKWDVQRYACSKNCVFACSTTEDIAYMLVEFAPSGTYGRYHDDWNFFEQLDAWQPLHYIDNRNKLIIAHAQLFPLESGRIVGGFGTVRDAKYEIFLRYVILKGFKTHSLVCDLANGEIMKLYAIHTWVPHQDKNNILTEYDEFLYNTCMKIKNL